MSNQNKFREEIRLEIIADGSEAQKKSWALAQSLEQNNISFNLNLSNQGIHKKVKKAAQSNSLGCLIIGANEITDSTVTVKWLHEHSQETIYYDSIIKYLKEKLEQC